MQEHAGTSTSGDCWGTADEVAGSSEFPIFQEQQLSPWSAAGLISALGRGSPCIGIVSSTCWRDAFFITSFISQTLFFMSYEAMLFFYEELLDL